MEPAASQPAEPQSEPTPSAESIAPEAGAASEERGGWNLRAAITQRLGIGRGRASDAPPPDEQAEGTQSDEAPEWQLPVPAEARASQEAYEKWLRAENQRYADRLDRDRERRAQQDEAAKLDAQIADLETKKETARAEGNTWEVGELDNQIAELKKGAEEGASVEHLFTEIQQTIAGETVAQFDGILDKLVLRIPEKERGALFPTEEEAKQMAPWEQRAMVAERVADAIAAKAEVQGREKARKDPVLRKEVMHDWRGTPEAEEAEPVLVSAAPDGGGPRDMNDFIRSLGGRRR